MELLFDNEISGWYGPVPGAWVWGSVLGLITEVKWEPQIGNPQEYNRNTRTLPGVFLVYSYYVLGVPCLGLPPKTL